MKSVQLQKKVLIIGAGEGGMKLLNIFINDPNHKVVCIVDQVRKTTVIDKLSTLGIPFSTEVQSAIFQFSPDLIINVTSDSNLQKELEKTLDKSIGLIGGDTSRLIWELISTRDTNKQLQMEITNQQLSRKSSTFIIGNSMMMKEVASLIDKVAATPTPVLIRGETGTGKELIAQEIHRKSHLADKAFVIINCTALTSTLVESELFGYVKGAFTGANADKPGLLEIADGGTVFLDEIGDMEMEVQAKLLRFLQTGEVRRVGDTKSKNIQVRVIAATNRDIEKAVNQGKFRGDLFYRFNTFTINLPPLSQRVEDIELFANHFLAEARARVNKQVESIHPQAISILQSYTWPGNLRELKNVVERAVVLTNGNRITADALPLQLIAGKNVPDVKVSLIENRNQFADNYEKQLLIQYLKNSSGNIVAAAREAGISRRTFHRLLVKHKIVSKSL